MKPIVKIEDWAILDSKMPYTARKQTTARLVGKVFGHPGHLAGKEVITSLILDITEDCEFAITENTIYELGLPAKLGLEKNQLPLIVLNGVFPTVRGAAMHD